MFKNADTGAHTNTIGGLWSHAKIACPAFNKKWPLSRLLGNFHVEEKTIKKLAATLYENPEEEKEDKFLSDVRSIYKTILIED